MRGELIPVILVPRFTSYLGAGAYETAPLEVSAYDRMVVRFECSFGTSIAAAFEESHDGITWFNLATLTNSGYARVDLTRRWLRLVVTLSSGIDCCWCAGNLRRRVG